MAFPATKNKWVNQRIHKRFNNNHRSYSKSLGKRSKNQRKGVIKQMNLDYDDFKLVFGDNSSHQNPTNTNMTSAECDIELLYQQYYEPNEHDMEQLDYLYALQHQSNIYHAADIDGVVVHLDLYGIDDTSWNVENSSESAIKPKRSRQSANMRQVNRQVNRRLDRLSEHQHQPTGHRANGQWDWSVYVPRDVNQENSDLELAIAASLLAVSGQQPDDYYNGIVSQIDGQREQARRKRQEEKEQRKQRKETDARFAVTTISVFGNKVRHWPVQSVWFDGNRSCEWLAETAWEHYKNNNELKIGHLSGRRNELQWTVHIDDKKEYSLPLTHVLEQCVPSLWPIYHLIFGYIGYASFHVTKAQAISYSPQQHYRSPKRRGIISNGIEFTYPVSPTYDGRRRYDDYTKDVVSYIPSYIYYKRDQKKQFRSFGQYSFNDWNQITMFSKDNKGKKQRIRIRDAMN